MNEGLTHVIICDSGQWVKGSTIVEARENFKRMHSSRSLKNAQFWAVTANTRITEDGQFAMPKSEFCEPVQIK